jgi:hypothetical protein
MYTSPGIGSIPGSKTIASEYKNSITLEYTIELAFRAF